MTAGPGVSHKQYMNIGSSYMSSCCQTGAKAATRVAVATTRARPGATGRMSARPGV